YEDLRLDRTEARADDVVRASVTLRNTGARPALETVQLYVSDDVTSVSWADRELKAFRQVEVPAGGEVEVTVDLPVADCTIVDAAGRRVVEPGGFTVLVGPSSRTEDLLTARVTVTG